MRGFTVRASVWGSGGVKAHFWRLRGQQCCAVLRDVKNLSNSLTHIWEQVKIAVGGMGQKVLEHTGLSSEKPTSASPKLVSFKEEN